MDTEIEPFKGVTVEITKTPRKPRPSEIAAKRAKKAAKRKLTKRTKREKKLVKTKAKKRPKVTKTKRKTGKSKKTPVVERCERFDMRVTKSARAKIVAKAKKMRRTITSLVIEAVEKFK